MKSKFFTILMILFAGSSSLFAQFSRLQVIHNAADPAAAVVDVYVNGSLLLNDFAFRDATPFSNVPSGVPLSIAVAPGNSASVADAIATFNVGPLMMNERYVLIANGVVGGGFAPNPDAVSISFDLFPFAGALESSASSGEVSVLVFHGSTDAPTVDVYARTGGGAPAQLIDDLSYTDFISGYATIPAALYALEVRDATGTVTVATYIADLSGVADAALVVFASGFLNPANNNNGPAFGLWAALPDGTTFPLPTPGNSRVQVIHNAADPAAASVDVYINGDLALNDFAFRTATSFLDIPSGIVHSIAVAPPNSASVGDAIATFPVGPLTDGERYVLFANGIVGSGFASNPDGVNISFSLYPFAGARESSVSSGDVDVLVFHGSTDAPTVDVDARTGGGAPIALINDLSYTEFSGYATVPAALYALDVKDATGTVTVATFIADLAGGADAALVVFASGFLNPANNNNGPAFGLWAALPDGTTAALPSTGTARVQVIHNSPDPLAATVDLYVNGLQGSPALNDLMFRKATPFFDVQTGYPTIISLNAPNSANADNALLGRIDFGNALMDGGSYIIIADGLADTIGKSGINPDNINPSFTLIAVGGARETGINPSNVDILIHHGSVDAPTVDIVARNVATIGNDLSYLDLTNGYISVSAGDYIIDVTDASGTTVVKSYFAPLGSAAGAAAVAFASGFLNPANGVSFGIWVALPSGATFALPEIGTARVQAIHNSADAAAAVVDVYVIDAIGGEIAKLDDVAFRTATPFLDLPSNVPLSIAFAPSNSASASEAVATIDIGSLETDDKYIAIANGILSGSGYSPSPAFTLHIFSGAREEATSQGASETDVLVYHGATDAPTVDVFESGAGAGTIVNDISYGEFDGYLSLASDNYIVEIRDASGATTVAAYQAPLATLGLEDAAITVLASGFLNPGNNSNGPAFGLYAALATGGALVPLPVYTGIADNNLFVKDVKFYPNPVTEGLNVDFTLDNASEVRIRLFSANGQEIKTVNAGNLPAGAHTMRTCVEMLARGYYLVQIEAGEKLSVSQQVFVK